MKKRKGILLILLLILLPNVTALITGNTITGKATTIPTNVSVQIIGSPPSLSLHHPENKTYLTNDSILLNYSVSGELYTWYTIDQIINITIFSPLHFNTSEGGHELTLYSNNSDGDTTTRNISFTVNTTLYSILYSEYQGSTEGTSTDFIRIAYEDIQNLAGIILEHTTHGTIEFKETINITNDANFSDRTTDLDTNTNISFNRIELNPTALPNFNVNATLELKNLLWANPRILLDGSACSATDCPQNSYAGETLSFNVSSHGIYTTEETSVSGGSSTGGSSGGGGGGGGAAAPRVGTTNITPSLSPGGSIFIDKQILKISIRKKETTTEYILIKNFRTEAITLDINTSLTDYIRIIEPRITIQPGKQKRIELEIIGRADSEPDLYLGTLLVKGSDFSKEIPIQLELETERPFFDVRITLPEQRPLYGGEELPVNVTVIAQERLGTAEVLITYEIRNIQTGRVILEERKSITILHQAQFLESLTIPKRFTPGEYILYVTVTYNDEIGSTTASILLQEKRPYLKYTPIMIGIIILIILYLFMRHHNHAQRKKVRDPHRKEVIKSARLIYSKPKPKK